MVKAEKNLIGAIHEKEIETAHIQNEIARLKIDALNTEAHTLHLDAKLNEEERKLDEKDQEISKIETVIRRRHNDIGGKMNRVDQLNRRYERMLDGVEEEEPLGPLESTIKALQKNINKMQSEVQMKQKEWTENQSSLIQTIGETETLESTKREIRATLNILKQKRLRLIQQIHTNDAALKIVQVNVKGMHHDMSRLNELIGKNTQSFSQLANDMGIKEMEFKHEVEELKRSSERIDVKILDTKKAKDEFLMKIIDVEKQILFWEKKINLEKEIQTTLSSSDHANETKGMQKEISRMKYKLDCMKKDQESMLREMELAIHKKEDIAVKYQYAKNGEISNRKGITVAELKKKRSMLMKQKEDIQVELRKVRTTCQLKKLS